MLTSFAAKAQQIDRRTRTLVKPVKIIWHQDTSHMSNQELLLTGDVNGQASNLDAREKAFTMSSREGGTPSILLDFGCELNGSLQIVTNQY